MNSALRIGILAEARYWKQAQPAGVMVALRKRGHQVSRIDASNAYDMSDPRWLDGLDLLLARGRSWEVLCILAQAEAVGVRSINRRAAIGSVHNKAEMAVALLAVGVPTPKTFLGTLNALATRVPETDYPLVLKPVFGDNGHGLRIAMGPDALRSRPPEHRLVLAQKYVSGDGYDLKLYGIGEEIWLVRKRSPIRAFAGPSREFSPRPVALTPRLRELGRRCGRLFGLDLFGVDCVGTPDDPVVIEVNDFPNYTGVPRADNRLAELVESRARREGLG